MRRIMLYIFQFIPALDLYSSERISRARSSPAMTSMFSAFRVALSSLSMHVDWTSSRLSLSVMFGFVSMRFRSGSRDRLVLGCVCSWPLYF